VYVSAFCFHVVRKNVGESDKLDHEQSVNMFHVQSKYRTLLTSTADLCELCKYDHQVQCSLPTVANTTNTVYSQSILPKTKKKMTDMVLEIATNSSHANPLHKFTQRHKNREVQFS
jgi:hypothetical protein